MHNFVYLAQRRSQEFSCEPNFGVPPPPLAAPVTIQGQMYCILTKYSLNIKIRRQPYISRRIYVGDREIQLIRRRRLERLPLFGW